MSQDIAKTVSKNMSVMTGAQVVTYLSSFVLMLFLPRYLGPEDFGRLYLGISLTGIFGIFIEFGCRYSVAKVITRNRDDAPRILMNAVSIRIVFWFISLLALVVVALILQYPVSVKKILLILGFGMLWGGLREVLRSFFQGFERMEYPSYAGIVNRVFMTIAGVTALLLGADAVVIAIIMVIADFLYFYVLARFARKLVASLPPVDWKASFKLIKEGVPYFLQTLFGFIYFRIDTVMLSLLTPVAVAGWYGAPHRLFDTLMFIPNIYTVAIFPVLARLWQKENYTMARVTQKSLEYILILGVPIAVSTFFLSREIIELLFGLEGYAPSVPVLQIFALGIILLYIDWIVSVTLLASDKQRQLSINAFIAIFISIGLNYLLIPLAQSKLGNGAIGSALSTLITEFYIMVVTLSLLPKEVMQGGKITVYVKSISAGLIMAGSHLAMKAMGVHWLVQLFVAPSVYVAALLSMKTFEPAELAFARNVLTVRNLKHTFIPSKDASV